MSTMMQKLRSVMGGSPNDNAGSGAVQAVWNGTVIAQSDRTVVIEGNHYFPPNAVLDEYLEHSDKQSVCPWKGTASYYDVVVNGERNRAAAWHYPNPKPAAQQIAGYVAFWHGVKVKRASTAAAAA